jgi:hypothetical protein
MVPRQVYAGDNRSSNSNSGQATLAYSTYLGGHEFDQIRDIAVDSQGNVYLAGGTESPNFPTSIGAYDTSHNGWVDVFVAKLGPNGKLIWSTFIGGPNYDRAYGIEVDRQGAVYLSGRAGPGFPVTPGAFQPSYNGSFGGDAYGDQNAFVAKLAPDGSSLVFASYFGTGQLSRDLAIDANGDIYLASVANVSRPLPSSWVSPSFQTKPQGQVDTVVAKIRSNGSQVDWATYLGGSGDEAATSSIRVHPTGVYVLTYTKSDDIATTVGAYDRSLNPGNRADAYVAKLSLDGSKLLFGTYLGGSEVEFGDTHNLAVDAAGNAYIAGTTKSADFPTTPGAFQPSYGGAGGADGNYPGDAFVAKLSHDGTQLLASTYVGGRSGEGAEGVAVDAQGNVFFSGATHSDNFPVTADAFQPDNAGGLDLFAVELSADFSRLLYATYLGGSTDDDGKASAIDANGNYYAASWTHSSNWPRISPPFQAVYGGGDGDAGFAKFVLAAPTNQAPALPHAPVPADGATDVPTAQVLAWQGGDPDGDRVTYTIALGLTSPPPVVATTSSTSYPPNLVPGSHYYWQVTATDGFRTSAGPVWDFVTAAQAPSPDRVQFGSPVYSVSEGTPSALITVNRVGGADSTVQVDYRVTGGTATAGVDYVDVSGTLTFEPAVTQQSFNLLVKDDHLVEDSETIQLGLRAPSSGASLGDPNATSVTLLDDDIAAPLVPTSVVISGPTIGSENVTYTFIASVSPDSVTLPLTYSWLVDNQPEVVHTNRLTDTLSAAWDSPGTHILTVTANNAAGSVVDTHELTIAPQAGLLQFSSVGYTVSEGTPSALITVNRVGGADSTVQVDYRVTGGTATAGVDYQPVSGTLTFDADVVSQTFSIEISEDMLVEEAETIDLALESPTHGASLGRPASAILTLWDNEPATVVPVVKLAQPDHDVAEEAGQAPITVVRQQGMDGAVAVFYETAGGTAALDADYTPVSGTLEFAGGVTQRSFEVPIVDDDLVEGGETIILSLSQATGGVVLGTPSTATLTIVDDDGQKEYLPDISK